jgi:hypothetical protein
MMSKVKDCPTCGKEVAKSAKVCPHCGKKLKTGLFVKIVLALIAFGVLVAIFGPSDEQKAQKLSATLDSIEKSEAANISPSGQISEIFSIGSENTDIQRENMEKEINGKIVQWTLPVYEVKKREENIYRITTSGTGYVGTFVTLHARNSQESSYIESLKTGSMFSFKGKIDGTTMRNIDIDPAVLVAR